MTNVGDTNLFWMNGFRRRTLYTSNPFILKCYKLSNINKWFCYESENFVYNAFTRLNNFFAAAGIPIKKFYLFQSFNFKRYLQILCSYKIRKVTSCLETFLQLLVAENVEAKLFSLNKICLNGFELTIF